MSPLLVFALSLVGSINAMPTNVRYFDLTHTFEETAVVLPGFRKFFQIDQLMNSSSDDFGGLWFKAEIYSQNSHSGTHMDAPSHVVPDGINIDEMPVSQFHGPAAVVDITERARLNVDAEVTVQDFLEWESGTGQSLNGTIVLIRTGWAEKYNDQAAYLGTADTAEDTSQIHYPGMSVEACHWLAENRNIKGLGSDTLSPESGVIFFSNNLACHNAMLPRGIFLLESVAVKKELPLYGASLTALPQKIVKGSGAPTRIVATVPKLVENLPTSCNAIKK
ncbi:isatin hydrolase-like [Parasteatoda tepidariorum]|uniref:isatin hydrolase-like n=1 Tax=Parasteatoda tepidariorum TaxID=114398 RepID=UPI001C728348|nr:isatin hydrolase-like [Parasteatoda tepidariorum]